jgi:hypothetical protein
MWNNGSGRRNINLIIPDIENFIRHDIHNGEITVLESGAMLEVARDPVFIT